MLCTEFFFKGAFTCSRLALAATFGGPEGEGKIPRLNRLLGHVPTRRVRNSQKSRMHLNQCLGQVTDSPGVINVQILRFSTFYTKFTLAYLGGGVCAMWDRCPTTAGARNRRYFTFYNDKKYKQLVSRKKNIALICTAARKDSKS